MADKKLAPKAIARKARAALRAKADPVRARGAERYFKHTIKCYGVAAPDVHALVSELHGLVKGIEVALEELKTKGREIPAIPPYPIKK